MPDDVAHRPHCGDMSSQYSPRNTLAVQQADLLVPWVFVAVAAEACKTYLRVDIHVEVAQAKGCDVRFADPSVE